MEVVLTTREGAESMETSFTRHEAHRRSQDEGGDKKDGEG